MMFNGLPDIALGFFNGSRRFFPNKIFKRKIQIQLRDPGLLYVDISDTLYSNGFMKRFEWDERKNAILKRNRGVSFEDALLEISEGRLMNMMENSNHSGQIIYVVRLNGYIHCVPAIEGKDFIRFITIYPSRKLNIEFKGRL